MDLITQVKTKVNTQVLVKGTVYKINEVGVIKDVSESDAAVLLENINWRVVGEVAGEKVPTKQESAPDKTGIKLIDAEGKVIPGQAHEDEPEEPKEPNANPYDPPIPEKGQEWADPDPTFSMGWLKACAKSYGISYRSDIGPAKLVEKIKKEMYG